MLEREIHRANAMRLDGPDLDEAASEVNVEVRIGEAAPPDLAPGEAKLVRCLRVPSGRLHLSSNGPAVLLAEVPPGSYEVEARFRGDNAGTPAESLLPEADREVLARQARRRDWARILTFGCALLYLGLSRYAPPRPWLPPILIASALAALAGAGLLVFVVAARYREPVRSAHARLRETRRSLREAEAAREDAPPVVRLFLRRLDHDPLPPGR